MRAEHLAKPPSEQPARCRSIRRRNARPIRRCMDAQMVEWNRWRGLRTALMRARVRRKNARTKIVRLETDLSIQRTHEREATQQVLDLWPQLPPEQRGYFNDDIEQLADEQMREAAE